MSSRGTGPEASSAPRAKRPERTNRLTSAQVGLVVVLVALVGAGCSEREESGDDLLRAYELSPDSAKAARIVRILSGLRHEVRFANRPEQQMALGEQMRRYDVPGVSVAVVDDYEVAWVRSYGKKHASSRAPVSTETLFHAKSVSKPVAAAVALRLVEPGKLELDIPLDSMLTSWNVPDNEFTRQTEPTLRHLLSHAAGFTEHGVASFLPSDSIPTLLETLNGEPADADAVTVDFEPGTRWRYSGGGYGVLQLLLRDATGYGFAHLADSLVLTPTGMDHSFHPLRLGTLRPFAAKGHDVSGSPVPGEYEVLPIQTAGGLWTTARDLAHFLTALERSWAGRADGLLKQSTAREMMGRQQGEWGLGLKVDSVDGTLRISHGGSGDGFKAVFVGFPDRGDGVVILANGDGAGELRFELLRSIASEYGWPGYEQTERKLSEPIDSMAAEAYTGEYEWNSGIRTTARFRDDQLEIRFGDEGRWRSLHPVASDSFVTWSNEVYKFVGDSVGDVTALTVLYENGEHYRAERVGE